MYKYVIFIKDIVATCITFASVILTSFKQVNLQRYYISGNPESSSVEFFGTPSE